MIELGHTCAHCKLWYELHLRRVITTSLRASMHSLLAPHMSFKLKHTNRNTVIEMLRLCPGDNMGQRWWLGSVLLQAGRHKDALAFAEVRCTGAPPPRGGCAFTDPSPNPISRAEYVKMSEYCRSELLYTGALAAFRLWGGDSLLARQYLRLGAQNNPAILMRLLGKVSRPGRSISQTRITDRLRFARTIANLNNLPRGYRGGTRLPLADTEPLGGAGCLDVGRW